MFLFQFFVFFFYECLVPFIIAVNCSAFLLKQLFVPCYTLFNMLCIIMIASLVIYIQTFVRNKTVKIKFYSPSSSLSLPSAIVQNRTSSLTAHMPLSLACPGWSYRHWWCCRDCSPPLDPPTAALQKTFHPDGNCIWIKPAVTCSQK